MQSSLSEIKKGLDPSFCHMILENVSDSPGGNDFIDFRPILSGHSGDVIEEASYRDRITGRSLLVVKIDPTRMEMIKQKLLNMKLPEHIIIYMFSDETVHR